MKRILLVLLLLFISIVCSGQTIRFMAGIEKDRTAKQQTKILQDLLPRRRIITYKHTEIKRLLKEAKSNETIILFSAACKHAYRVVTETNSEIWIVEPHYTSAKTIKESIRIGLPKRQIILGPKINRGFGISSGCLMTPKGMNHFQSLEFLSTFLIKK